MLKKLPDHQYKREDRLSPRTFPRALPQLVTTGKYISHSLSQQTVSSRVTHKQNKYDLSDLCGGNREKTCVHVGVERKEKGEFRLLPVRKSDFWHVPRESRHIM